MIFGNYLRGYVVSISRRLSRRRTRYWDISINFLRSRLAYLPRFCMWSLCKFIYLRSTSPKCSWDNFMSSFEKNIKLINVTFSYAKILHSAFYFFMCNYIHWIFSFYKHKRFYTVYTRSTDQIYQWRLKSMRLQLLSYYITIVICSWYLHLYAEPE